MTDLQRETSLSADIFRDLLDRLDSLTQHIIEMKSEMYKRSDFAKDSDRIYDDIKTVETETVQVVRDAVKALEDVDKRLCERLDKVEKVPWLRNILIAGGSAAATAFSQYIVPALTSYVHITFGK